MSLENLRGLEEHDPALLIGHLDPCLGIAAHALALVAQEERAEPGEFHGLAGSPCCQKMRLMADLGG